MDAIEQTFWELAKAHEAKFGEQVVVQEPSGSMEEMIPILRKCLETNTPYGPPKLPPGCIA